MTNTMQSSTNLHGIYAITDPRLLPDDKLLLSISETLKGGVRLVQYRDKLSSSIDRLRNAQKLLACCKDFGATLIINDDIDLCARIGADGVHLGQTDMHITSARKVLGEAAIIGITCHDSLSLAKTAIKQSASYVALGRFYPSNTKASATLCHRSIIKKVKFTLNCRLAVIGGITLGTAQSLINDGADMIAICQGLFHTSDIQKRTQALIKLFSHTNRI